MTTSPEELEAARFFRAALDLIGDRLPIASAAHSLYVACRAETEATITAMDAPPWTPDRPERDLPWSDVICGDSVKAPNGAWYEVESWSRTGPQVAVMLLVNGARVKSVRKAADKVPVRRGPAGQAADVFAAAGFDLEVLAA